MPFDTPSRLELNSVPCESGMGLLVTSFQGVIKILQILLCSLLGHLSWGKLATLLWRHSCSPLERPTWWRFQKLRPPANSHVSAPSWKQILNPSQAFKWLQPHEIIQARTTQIKHSRVLWEMLDVYSCLKPLSFEAICYAAIITNTVMLPCSKIQLLTLPQSCINFRKQVLENIVFKKKCNIKP